MLRLTQTQQLIIWKVMFALLVAAEFGLAYYLPHSPDVWLAILGILILVSYIMCLYLGDNRRATTQEK